MPESIEEVELPEDQFDDGDFNTLVNKTVKYFANEAFRTILVCYRDMSMDEYNALMEENNGFEKDEDRKCLESGLTAIGIYGIQDPLRDGIIESIK
jgi:magnesium-transporting ATPase (P-type)